MNRPLFALTLGLLVGAALSPVAGAQFRARCHRQV